jgi:hypothetical protein
MAGPLRAALARWRHIATALDRVTAVVVPVAVLGPMLTLFVASACACHGRASRGRRVPLPSMSPATGL